MQLTRQERNNTIGICVEKLPVVIRRRSISIPAIRQTGTYLVGAIAADCVRAIAAQCSVLMAVRPADRSPAAVYIAFIDIGGVVRWLSFTHCRIYLCYYTNCVRRRARQVQCRQRSNVMMIFALGLGECACTTCLPFFPSFVCRVSAWRRRWCA